MNRTWRAALIAAAFVASGAQAQQYRWIDKNGKKVYGDIPPIGVKAVRLKPAAGAPAPAANTSGTAAARKGPVSPAEQEQEFRKRQLDAEKARQKAEKDRKDAESARDNCRRSQENLRVLESGQRVPRTNAQGERYFLGDDQRAQEVAQAKQRAAEWCK